MGIKSIKGRTAYSLQNTKIALVYYILTLVATFVSRKVFIEVIGAEVLGLNTTATNLLGLLNLTELGIGFAVSFSLYKPLFERDKKEIKEIISVQGWLYKNIAILILVAASILMSFFPIIFSKSDLPLWYAYSTFSVLLYSSILGYFINYKQIILSADQKQYKIILTTKTLTLIQIFFQIIILKYTSLGYIGWLFLEFLFASLIAWRLDLLVRKNYPWLKTSFKLGKQCYKKQHIIISKTKQLFFHRIAGYILTQTSPLIIFAYTDLKLVAIYGNYMLMVSGARFLIDSIFNGITSSVGNLVAENIDFSIKRVFNEIYILRMFLTGILIYGLWIGGDCFVKLWIGESFLFGKNTFFLIILISFINMTRICDNFIQAYGLFSDIWAPIIESILNIGFSILLGSIYGLQGILIGVIISLIVVVLGWKPYFLLSSRQIDRIPIFYLKYIHYCILLFLAAYITSFFLGNFPNVENITIGLWITSIAKYLFLYALVGFILFFITSKYMRSLANRLFNMLKTYYLNEYE